MKLETEVFGKVFQNPVMLPWLKTLDNVLLPLKIVSSGGRTTK